MSLKIPSFLYMPLLLIAFNAELTNLLQLPSLLLVALKSWDYAPFSRA